MRVKVTNPRSGAIDYVSHIFRLNVPAYADKMLVDLPADTAEKWIIQLEKDGLIVEMVPVETAPAEPVLPTPVEPEAEEKKAQVINPATAIEAGRPRQANHIAKHKQETIHTRSTR